MTIVPRNEKNMAEVKRQQLEQTLLELKSEIIPGLKQLKPEFRSGNVRFYEGDDGVETVLRDILQSVSKQEDKTYCVISTSHIRDHLYRPFPNFTIKYLCLIGLRNKIVIHILKHIQYFFSVFCLHF